MPSRCEQRRGFRFSARPRLCGLAIQRHDTPPSFTAASARARAMRCHWPPDKSVPPSYPRASTVSSVARFVAPADSRAARTMSSGAPAGATLSRSGNSRRIKS